MKFNKLLFFSFAFAFAFVFVLKGANGVEEETCPYDYNVIQRVGKSDYMTGQPMKIIDQSTTTVKFTVGNTWTNDENDVLDEIFVVYPANGEGERKCYLDTNVATGQSIDTSLKAHCTQAGVALVRIYIRDSSFKSIKDTAQIPNGCYDNPDDNNNDKRGLEYVGVLNCLPTCSAEDEDNIIDHPFEISYPLTPISEITLFSCPDPGDENDGLMVLPSSFNKNGGLLELKKSSSGNLCTLIEVNSNAAAIASTYKSIDARSRSLVDGDAVETIGIKPVARTYNGYGWEASAGEYSSSVFDCNQDNTCTVLLPAINPGRSYALKSYSNRNISDMNKRARFLEKVTFGPTRSDIKEFTSPADWVTDQFEMKMTSHRAFYRQHLTHWHQETSYHSLLDTNACEKGARFRKYTFISTDIDRMMTITVSPNDSSKLIIAVDGQTRSIVEGPAQCGNWEGPKSDLPEGEYQICYHPLDGLEGIVRVKSINNNCDCELFFGGTYGNPIVQFDDVHLPDLPTIDLNDENIVPVLSDRFFNSDVETEMLQLSSSLTDSYCDEISGIIPGAPEILRVGVTTNDSGGKDYWIHTTSFQLRSNEIGSPLPDGGKDAMTATADAPYERMMTACSSAPRTFLNEDSCILSDNACYDGEGPDVDIILNLENLEKIHTATGGAGGEDTRYVYVVEGLRIDNDSLEYIDYPCTAGGFSRWIRVENCTDVTAIGKETKTIFEKLLGDSSDSKNELVKDVFFPLDGKECDSDDSTFSEFSIFLNGQCWQNTHPHNYQVFDMTYWTTDAHPGNINVNRIKAFADDGDNPTWVLTFPDWHDMKRWHINMENFPNVGRFMDNTTLKSLPTELFRDDIAQSFGSTPETVAASGSVMVCGSPFEVATSHGEDAGILFKGGFDMYTRYNHTTFGLEEQRTSIWMDIALKAQDQLRQRTSFALSQIVVMSPGSISERDYSEPFVAFYDIFVRHSFGKYFDILKEVTYNPLMAEMLTYKDGASTGYSWARHSSPSVMSPDENYAREIMQLFTIGLYKMNIDGTAELDSSGNPIATYTNKDITEYSKVYTGFHRRKLRSNVEDPRDPKGWGNNMVDPLQINAEKKDHFPKLGLDRQYIGDGFPICSDLPLQNWLKSGATYRLLGSNSAPDLLNDPTLWHDGPPKRLSLNFASSILASTLCGGNVDECMPTAKFVLDKDIKCDGEECDVDEPRSFEVAPGVYYEYIRPPCVNHAFYKFPKTIFRRWYNDRLMCGNPKNHDASTVCCDNTFPWGEKAWRNEKFSGERVNFDTAQNERCTADKDLRLCSDTWITADDCSSKSQGGCDNRNLWYWTYHDCTLSIKINTVGSIAIVHEHGVPEESKDYTYKMVRHDTKMFFRADWESDDDLDDFLFEYQTGCTELGGFIDPDDGLCQCNVGVESIQLFADVFKLISIKNVLSQATIGAFQPDEDGEDVPGVEGIRMYPKGALSTDTVFEVIDDNGRKHFRKNIVSRVLIDGGEGGRVLKFRNPVSFFSISEFTERDARYELDAALEHIYYHQNMAPFLARLLSQRFGVSNPSPRYIETAATAFRTGLFEGFGSGEYGCLKATIAALLLDREAQDDTLDPDPTQGAIREPFLKLTHIMRSLEFEPRSDSPFLRFGMDVQDAIGQSPHKIPSVFSFFRPEYKPSGRIASAGLVSPESQILNGPTSVNTINMMTSFVKYGASDCFGGFGRNQEGKYGWDHTRCIIGSSTNFGLATYNPITYGLNSSGEIVDDLATLLTGGRLSDTNRQLIIEAYEYTLDLKKDPYEAMVNAQQLMLASPEFQTTNTPSLIGGERPISSKPQPSGKPYKAVIYLMLAGGADSYNMLVPDKCTGENSDGITVSEQYLTHRGNVAFDRQAGEFDVTIDSTSSEQPCSSFAVHDELDFVKELYDSKDLVWIANAGVVNQNGMNKNNFNSKTKTQLFAHNAMEAEVKKVDPYNEILGTGVLGRANDILQQDGYNVNAFNIDESAIVLDGKPGESSAPIVISSNGINAFGERPDGKGWKHTQDEMYFDIERYAGLLNAKTSEFSGMYGELWSQVFTKGITDAYDLKQDLDETAQMNESIWEGSTNSYSERHLRNKFKTVASLMQTHESRGTDREIFSVGYGGFDHHDQMKANLRPKMQALNANLKRLVGQLKEDGLWDNTVIYVTSEFARTITPNQNDGSDHAWAQNVMLMGGNVNGGQILGKYPNDITPTSRLDDGSGRGRFIPTTSNDAIWNSIIQWYGVTEEADLDTCLPNRYNTVNPVEGEMDSPLFTLEDMFESQ